MEIGQIITGSIMALLSIASGIYVFFTAQEKGPIFSNTYIWLSKKDREKADKKGEYKLVTVVFGCLSVIFALSALNLFTQWKWAYYLMWLFIAFVIVYAIADGIQTISRK